MPVGFGSAIEGGAVLGVSGGVGRHEGALRDHAFPIAPRCLGSAMRQSRSVAKTRQLLRHFRMEQHDAAVLDLVGRDRERIAAEGHFKPAHGHVVPDVAFRPRLLRSEADKVSRPECGGLRAHSALSVCLDEQRRIMDSLHGLRTYLFDARVSALGSRPRYGRGLSSPASERREDQVHALHVRCALAA